MWQIPGKSSRLPTGTCSTFYCSVVPLPKANIVWQNPAFWQVHGVPCSMQSTATSRPGHLHQEPISASEGSGAPPGTAGLWKSRCVQQWYHCPLSLSKGAFHSGFVHLKILPHTTFTIKTPVKETIIAFCLMGGLRGTCMLKGKAAQYLSSSALNSCESTGSEQFCKALGVNSFVTWSC